MPEGLSIPPNTLDDVRHDIARGVADMRSAIHTAAPAIPWRAAGGRAGAGAISVSV